MSNSKKVSEKDLSKLEDQAYFELRQIIAEAMQYQDVELLDARIASWKTKYKKLLDRPSTSSKSDFKKRIEYLLKQYYSGVTQYILNQLKLKEEKKVKNQAKALRQLYRIIKDTNDLDLLKKKVKKWEQKYTISAFLKMYQKRIKSYTREKNLKENAFEQEKAFHDLVDITKKNETIDELKERIEDWEDNYGINDKYSIDDFLKHQSEIKRFTSNEFLISIAQDDNEPDKTDKTEPDIIEEYNNKYFSDLSTQASSYASFKAISQSNVNEMFKWVYNNRNIKFNDKYKELIINGATRLGYSPTYLKELSVPSIDISENSLSYDQYKKIEEIKEYAIISYFNLLLPPEKAMSNNYFTRYAQTIYNKYYSTKIVPEAKDPSLNIDNMLSTGIEVSLKSPDDIKCKNAYISEENGIQITPAELDIENIHHNIKSQKPELETEETINLSKSEKITHNNTKDNKYSSDVIESTIASETCSGKIQISGEDSAKKKSVSESSTSTELEKQNNELNYDTVVALSPLFIATIYNLDKQATIIDCIDSDTTEYIEKQNAQELELSTVSKTKLDI